MQRLILPNEYVVDGGGTRRACRFRARPRPGPSPVEEIGKLLNTVNQPGARTRPRRVRIHRNDPNRPHQAVMGGLEVEPALITKPGGQIGRADDVCEKGRWPECGPLPAQDERRLRTPRSRRGPARRSRRAGTSQLQGAPRISRPGCARRDTGPSAPDNADSRPGAGSTLEPGCSAAPPYVHLKHPPVHPGGRRGRGRESHVPASPALNLWVAGHAGSRELEYDSRSPRALPNLEEPLSGLFGHPDRIVG